MDTQIKICGITSEQEAEYLNEAQADYAGFVFFEKSKRNVTAEQADRILQKLDVRIRRVAVTVNPDIGLVRQIESAGFSILQIHGALDEAVFREIRLPIWRAVNIADLKNAEEQIERLKPEESKITGYVVDAASYGSGRTFSWESFLGNREAEELLVRFRRKTFVLAGGLRAENIDEAMDLFSPDVVDVSSGVEGKQGKEKTKITEFVRKVRKHG